MTLHHSRFLVPLLLVTLSLGLAAPVGATAAQQDTSRPQAMRDAFAQSLAAQPTPTGTFQPQQRLAARGLGGAGMAPTVQAAGTAGTPGYPNAGLKREVFGFVNAGNLGDTGFGYPSWQFPLLSTVAYFGLQVNSGDGALVQSGTPWTVWNSQTMSDFIHTAHVNGTIVVLSVILQDFASGTPAMCSGLTHASTTISQTLAQVRAHGIDGVNIDYEGLNGSCGTSDPNTARSRMTSLVRQFRTALGGYNLSVDTYAASAGDSLNFFDVPGMAPSVDSFFVMAYDSDFSNYSHLGCSQYCLNPVSPTTGFYYNDTRAATEYAAAVDPGKVILGLPYYGRKGCVAGANPYSVPTSNFASPTYTDAASTPQTAGVSAFSSHTDGIDPTEEYDTWRSSTYNNCIREQYWENVASLGAKYDLVNNHNLRGAGIFTLDYGGGAPELWNSLAAHFSYIPGAPGSVVACAGTGSASISWTAAPSAGGPVSSYTVTASPGGATVTVGGGSTFAVLGGLTAGTSYTFSVAGRNSYGAGVTAASNPVTPSASAPVYTGYFSWYDRTSPGMTSDDIHLYNPDPGQAASGCATLGGVRVAPISLAPHQALTFNFPGGDSGGPVAITVMSGPAIEASQRVKYYSSFNEIAATPLSSASTSLWFPWFDHVSNLGFVQGQDNIHVVNPGSAATAVTVNVPGCPTLQGTIQPGGYQVFSCSGFGGPVSITSANPVIASQRVQYYQSFNEVSAQPGTAAGTSLLVPWFDRLSSPDFIAGQDNLHLVNPGSVTANVTVTIPGCGPQAAAIGAGRGAIVSCAGGFGGPATVSSSSPVLASQRVSYRSSFNEVPALPATSAATSLHFAWFDRLSDLGFVNGADNIHVLNPPGGVHATFTVSIPGCSAFGASLEGGQEQIFSCPGGFGGPVSIVASAGRVLASQRVQYYDSFNEVQGQSP